MVDQAAMPVDMPRQSPAETALPLRTQQAVLRGLTHDLRAPLRTIDGFAILLQRYLIQHQGMDATSSDHLQRIRDAANGAASLLDALQELTSAGRAPLRHEQVDLSLMADWVAAELQDLAPAREASVHVMPGLSVRGDEYYLKRMLARLLENAWRFSPPNVRVQVEIEGERIGERVQLRIRDHGIGFDMRYADRLFEPYQRLHGAEEGAGAGLGLAIAQCIAQRHGGRIRAESTVGAGSVFHVELVDAAPADAGDG